MSILIIKINEKIVNNIVVLTIFEHTKIFWESFFMINIPVNTYIITITYYEGLIRCDNIIHKTNVLVDQQNIYLKKKKKT